MTDSTRQALKIARYLTEAGCPVFRARPALDDAGEWDLTGGHNGTGYLLPRGWHKTRPGPEAIDAWEPGDALCLVTGVVVDVLDLDTYKGLDDIRDLGSGELPTRYGVAATPSGGRHHLIAPLGVGSHNGVLHGVDVKSGRPDGTGRGFVFLAPTAKVSKTTGEVGPYTWLEEPDLELLLLLGTDASGGYLRGLVEVPRPAAHGYDVPDYGHLPARHRLRAEEELQRQLDGWRDRLAGVEDWPDGETDDQGRGWEALSRDLAWSLARLATTPWAPEFDAEGAYLELLPDALAANRKCQGKWRDDLLERAAAEPPGPPPWIARPDAGDDFAEPVEDEEAPPGEGSSWDAVDLGPYLDGTYVAPMPELMPRSDGVCLLYPGRTHSIHGESESGKSMLIMVEAARLIMASRPVCYVDYENGPDTILERLFLMGATRAQIREQLTVIRPETDPAANDLSRKSFAALLAQRFDLVVIDSVNEALILTPSPARSKAGLGGNDDVTVWHKNVPGRIAERTGAAVVVIDHVAKGENGNGRFAIGGQAKMATISGAAYVVRPVSPIGVGLVGELEVWIGKDRGGQLRGTAGSNFDKNTRMQLIAQVEVDGRDSAIRARLDPPPVAEVEATRNRLREAVAGLLTELPDDHPGLSTRAVRAEVKGQAQAIGEELKWLVQHGFADRKAKGQGFLYLMKRPYMPEFE